MLDPAADELMVRMVASGVCGTDVHAVSGEQPIPRFPVVLGHEGAGVVEKVGPGVVGFVPGDHVVIALYADCGRCRQCIRGRVDECDSDWRRAGFIGIQGDGRSRIRQSDDEIYPMFGVGTLAEYTTIRAGQAVRIDPDLPLESMCLTACGVATGLGAVLHSADVRLGDSVLVVGCGGVGLNVVQGARIAGATTIVAAGIDDARLALARRLGATHVIDTRDVPLDVSNIVPGGVDFAFEVVGSPDLIASCLALTRIGGTCVMVGLTPPGAIMPADGRVLAGARRLVGCRSGGGNPQHNVPLMAELHGQGRLLLDELIGRRLPFAEVASAFRPSAGEAAGRTVVTFR